jgi:type I restriction enzyme S subunit
VNAWAETALGSVATLQRGYDLPEDLRVAGAVPIVSSSGISGYHNEARCSGPGVATGRYGTLGRVYFIREDFWLHNTTLFVRDFHGNDPRFVYYLLTSIDLATHSAVSAVPGLNRNDIHRLPVMLPPLPIQRRIAGILGRLDDKIEVNRRINRTLEAMAQALYRHWFVESELGLVPKGWEGGKLGDIASVQKEVVDPAEVDPKTPYIGLADMPQGSIALDTWGRAGDSIRG